MSRYQGKHGRDEQPGTQRRRIALGAIAALLMVGLIVALSTVNLRNNNDSGTEAQAANSDSPTSDNAVKSCKDAATVAVSSPYEPAWEAVAAKYAEGQDCAPIALRAAPSTLIAAGAREVDGWIPEDAAWLDRAKQAITVTGEAPIVAMTPVVSAMPAALAKELAAGGGAAMSPDVLGALVRGERSVPAYGDQEAGELRVALPDPAKSVAGAVGFAAFAIAASGEPLTAAPDYVSPTRAELTVIRAEQRIVNVAGDDTAVLEPETQPAGGPANLYLTTEAAAMAYNEKAKEPMAIGYVPGMAIRMPLATIEGGNAKAVSKFADFLASEKGKTALIAAGLRPADNSAVPTATEYADTTAFTPAEAPLNAEQITNLTNMFGFLRLRISTLAVVDISGSMLEALPGGTESKIDIVRRTARIAIQTASPRARSGLITFSSVNGSNKPVIETRVPLSLNSDLSEGDETYVQRWARVADAIKPTGGTPLYNAVMKSYQDALDKFDPKYINQIVVLSDGANRDTTDGITRAQMIRFLKGKADPDKPVRVVAIGIGQDADMGTLRAIADATGGKAGWLRSSQGYENAVREALFTP